MTTDSIPTPLENQLFDKLESPTLYMETPDFVITAAETLRNVKLHKENRSFLAVRMENDTKVL